MPALAREIVEQIRAEIPEYGEDPTGEISAETQRTVIEALRMFMRNLAGQGQLDAEQGETFRRIGRLEAQAGRSHDTLQAAYRIASQLVVRRLLDWERQFEAPRELVAHLSSAVFAFIDHLATLSAEGFAEAQADRADDSHRRAQLLSVLLHRGGFTRRAAAAQAARLDWTLPESCAVIEAVRDDALGDAEVVDLGRALFGAGAVAGRAGRRALIIAPDAVDVATVAALVEGIRPALGLVVGPVVPLAEVASSARLVQRAVERQLRSRSGDAVVVCDEHLLELLDDGGREVIRAMGRRRLGPLQGLTPAKRVKYGRLLSAWLEFGSIHGDAPGVLDKHRQTLRYQVAHLERWFGAELLDRDARLEIMLALRSALPIWECEVAARQRRSGQRDDPDFVPDAPTAATNSSPMAEKSGEI
jgi:hypothetical protein